MVQRLRNMPARAAVRHALHSVESPPEASVWGRRRVLLLNSTYEPLTALPIRRAVVMLLCGTANLREISLFPMNQQALDVLMGAPGDVTPRQLRELHIRLKLPEK